MALHVVTGARPAAARIARAYSSRVFYKVSADDAIVRGSSSLSARREALEALANQAFSRAAGAPLVEGNRIVLLEDARENYPAWLDAIAGARAYIHFESYIINEDETGEMFADALIAKAESGVHVRLLYDWLGAVGKTSSRFWSRLRAGGVEVRRYNPPSLASPLGWLNRDHRKVVVVDGRIGIVTGLCVGNAWVGDPERGFDPWRDTGVLVEGPAVADIEHGFAEVWAATGEPIPESELPRREELPKRGTSSLRVVAGSPATAGMLRVDQLVAALAHRRLWLSDAYYAGTTSYAQALCAAALDGVDVRLLVPGSSDISVLVPFSRIGYRPLLAAGVRVFEWNGSMMHAKTAVADSHWARVGSTNLNIASWLTNYEMDVVAEDDPFAEAMERAYVRDLENATELVLDRKRHVCPREQSRAAPSSRPHASGSGGRAAAGAVRLGQAMGAAFTENARVLAPVDGRLLMLGGVLGVVLAAAFVRFPAVLAYPFAVLLAWLALSLIYRGYRQERGRP